MARLSLRARAARHLLEPTYVRFAQYQDGGIVILLNHEDGERAAVATVNMPEAPLPPNCVWLKGWSENEGIPEALERAGVVRLLPTYTPAGYTQAQMAELTPAALEQLAQEKGS